MLCTINDEDTIEVQLSGAGRCDPVAVRVAPSPAHASPAGVSKNVDVRLDFSHVEAPPTYINLVSHRATRLHNRSTIPIRYEMRRFASAAEDRKHRAAMLAELDAEEAAAMERLRTAGLGARPHPSTIRLTHARMQSECEACCASRRAAEPCATGSAGAAGSERGGRRQGPAGVCSIRP